MTLSDFFQRLDAPLRNVRWSWGAKRESDGAIFLRVWQDECRRLEGSMRVRVSVPKEVSRNEGKPGREERKEHIAEIRGGAPTYLIMCRAENPGAHPRTIAGFNSSEVFVGGEVIEDGDGCWVEIIDRRPADDVRS